MSLHLKDFFFLKSDSNVQPRALSLKSIHLIRFFGITYISYSSVKVTSKTIKNQKTRILGQKWKGGRWKLSKRGVWIDLPSSWNQWAELGTGFVPIQIKKRGSKNVGEAALERSENLSLHRPLFHLRLNGLPRVAGQLVWAQSAAN